MDTKHINKTLSFDKSKDLLPFHYPISFNKNKQGFSLNNIINKEEFYFIYNEYQKKYMKNKIYNINIPNNINDKKNKNIYSSFNKKNKYIPKRKNNSNEFSNSISMIKNNKTNNDSSIRIETSFIDKNFNNDESLYDKHDDKSKIKLKKYSSYFNPCSQNLNINNNKIPFSGKLRKNQGNNSFNFKKENKNKSLIFHRNSNNRLFSSKSFNANNKNLKLETIDDNKYNNKYIQNYINKEMIYNKRMEKIDKLLKMLNDENQKKHNLSFNKNKNVTNIINKNGKEKYKKLKNIKMQLMKEYNKNITISNGHKVYKNNNNLINKSYYTPKEINIKRKENNIDLNAHKIKYDQKQGNKKNKILEYVLKYQKFSGQEYEKNLNIKPFKSIKKENTIPQKEEIKVNAEIININKNNQMNICKENIIEIKNKNRINKISNIPFHSKDLQTITNGQNIILDKKFGIEKLYNKLNNKNIIEDDNKIVQNNEIDYKNNFNNTKDIKRDVSYKFTNCEEGTKESNIEKDKKNYSLNNIFKTKSNNIDNNTISDIRRYLNNYYEIKYRKKIIKNNSFHSVGDNSNNYKETCYYNMLKNNLLQKLIKDENSNKDHNNNYFNNVSSNVNINININPNNIQNKNIDINLINCDRNSINKEKNRENNDQNNLQLLTPSFMKNQDEINHEKEFTQQKFNQQNSYKNNELNELHNFRNNFSFIPYDTKNNNKFPIFFGQDYTFKNMNINYRNKLTKNNLIKLNHSSKENHKNIFVNENQTNKQTNYNIKKEKRKEDLYQLLHFSQNLGLK